MEFVGFSHDKKEFVDAQKLATITDSIENYVEGKDKNINDSLGEIRIEKSEIRKKLIEETKNYVDSFYEENFEEDTPDKVFNAEEIFPD